MTSSASSAMQPAKRRFRQMTEDEQRELIVSGRRKFRNCIFKGSDFERLYATDCTIRGNNVHVIGNGNLIIGTNNRATGTGNTFSVPEPPAPPPRPASPPRPAAVDDANFSFVFGGHDFNFTPISASAANEPLLSFIVDAIRAPTTRHRRPRRQPAPIAAPPTNALPSPPNTTAVEVRPAVQTAFSWLPAAGTDQRNSSWKKSALDLPGEPSACENEELRCVVCLDHKKDILFEPCHHVCCCRACAKELTCMQKDPLLPLKCPECREPVQYMSILFM